MIQDIYKSELEVGNFSVVTFRVYRVDYLFVCDMCHWELFGGCRELFSGTKQGLIDKLKEEYSTQHSKIESGSLTVNEIYKFNKALKVYSEARKALEIYPYEDDPVCDLWV